MCSMKDDAHSGSANGAVGARAPSEHAAVDFDLFAALYELHAAAEVMPSSNSDELIRLHLAVEIAGAAIARGIAKAAQLARAEATPPHNPNARHSSI